MVETPIVGPDLREDGRRRVVLGHGACPVVDFEFGSQDRFDLAAETSVVEPVDALVNGVSTSVICIQQPLVA